MNMFARLNENQAMTLQDIKETKRYGRTHGRTHGRTDNVKTVYPLQTKFAGGINNRREIAIMKIPIRFYYDLGASTTLLLRSCRFCYNSCRFDQNFES